MTPEITLTGKRIRAGLDDALRIFVEGTDGRPLWESSRRRPPRLIAATGRGPIELPLAAAASVVSEPWEEGRFRGPRLRLGGYEGADLAVGLFLGIDADAGELLVQVEQLGGPDTASAVRDLYRIEKPVGRGGWMLLPHGSGYLVPAGGADELPGAAAPGGLVGTRWALPLFALAAADRSLCALVDTWWDCDVTAEHAPGEFSALSFNWEASLGRLAYPRRLLLRFAEDADYAGMAKWYRGRASAAGLVRPLAEKAEQTPAVRAYAGNVLYRWPAWNPDDGEAVLGDVRRLRGDGIGVNFFFPKWSPAGYSPEEGTPTTCTAGWQAYLHPDPVPGGWDTLVRLERRLHDLGCLVQGFVNPGMQVPEGSAYDPDRYPRDSEGRQGRLLSGWDAAERMGTIFDSLERRGLGLDAMYYDGFSAHGGLPEDFSPSHRMTRRGNLEAETACFAETRGRGLMPGAELARFWAIGECDFFFFTDWASDRLSNEPTRGCAAPVGMPVPLFQLVFHDCFMAGFSGGGYSAYAGGYDWWKDRTPRLYELLFASAPSYNWLPYPVVPMVNWGSEQQRAKQRWLVRWSAFHRAVAFSEMVSHRFLDADGSRQRTGFANGVEAEFDFAGNRFRIEGAGGFDGAWEVPPEL